MVKSHGSAWIEWKLGQVLRPEHFRTLEGSASERAEMLVGLDGLPRHGVTRLSWNRDLLRAGELRLDDLEIRFASGFHALLGDNSVLQNRSLRLADGGSSRVAVHLHRVGWTTADSPPLEEGELPVARRHAILRVTTTDVLTPPSLESLKLAEFVQDGQGSWSLLESYVPPLLSVLSTPYLQGALASLEGPLDRLRGRFVQQLSFQWLEGTSLAGIKSSLQQIYAFQALLADLRGGIEQHPYVLFRQLRSLFFEFFFFQSGTEHFDPEWARRGYDHEKPATCVLGLIGALRQICDQEWPLPSFAHFQRENAVMSLRLPTDLTGDEDFYLWIRKTRREAVVDASSFKLAARSRLERLHKLSLKGIGLERAPLPAFARQLDPNVELFRFLDSEERDLALREGELAFYAREGQTDFEAALSWGASLSVGGLA